MKQGTSNINTLRVANVGGNKKFDDNEINEAKESLKLLKMKLGNLGGNSENNFQSKNTINQSNNYYSNNYGNSSSHNSNTNYRKPFKPNFDNEENAGHNFNMKQTSSRPKNNNNYGKKLGIIILYCLGGYNKKYEEFEDDRPAYNINGGIKLAIYNNFKFAGYRGTRRR